MCVKVIARQMWDVFLRHGVCSLVNVLSLGSSTISTVYTSATNGLQTNSAV